MGGDEDGGAVVTVLLNQSRSVLGKLLDSPPRSFTRTLADYLTISLTRDCLEQI